MGELEEKETAENHQTTEKQSNVGEIVVEPKETDKMLQKEEEDTKKPPVTPPPASEEIIINIPEVADNKDGKKENDDVVDVKKDKSDSKKLLAKEDREVKPKKIPIGGMKLPGFFTKTKPKGEGDGADGELLEKETKEDENNKEKKAEEKPPCLGDRIRNFFSKKKKPATAASEEAKNEPSSNDETAPPQKKGLLNAIKLPIANMIPRKKTEDDVELGTGPGTKAGLASMETLDDSLKDQDQVDKVLTKTDDNFEKTKDEKDSDGPSEEVSCWESIKSYRCSVDNALITLGLLSFVLLLSIIGYVLCQEKPTTPPIRKGKYIDAVTSCGPVEGLKDDSAFAFRGIPYAQPPINEMRFKAAKVIDNIDLCWNGTLKAHNSTNVCSQLAANGSLIGIEDCLFLDIITPHVRYENPLPVVVLIGADTFTSGSPNVLRPTARFARAKDVVFVRPNFRMGPLGFLATDAITRSAYPPSSGNYALTDIIAVLQWIQLNIKHFGGDPNSVTLVGHKTGGTLVQALITSKSVKDLYARAWISSSSSIFPGKPLQEAEQKNQRYMNEIKCEDIECLRNATVEQIWEAVPDTWRHYAVELPTENDENEGHEWLVLDGVILTQHPADIWKKETNGNPRLVIGTTAHESHSTIIRGKSANWTAEEIRSYIEKSKIGTANLTDEVISRYNATTYEGLVAIISDIRTICPLLTIARQQPTAPFYVVTQTDTKSGFALAEDDVDIQGILSRYEPHTVEQRRYVSAIQQLFYHFVSHGIMEQYKPTQKVLIVGQDPLPQSDYSNCDFWISKDFVPRYAKID